MFSFAKLSLFIIATIKKKIRRGWIYINKNDNLYLFWITFIYYFFSTFNFNNKTIFVSLIALGFTYNLHFKNIRFSLLFTTVASLIFLVGKTWIIQLIPPELLRSSDYPKGYISVITITPFQIFSSLILAFLLRDLIGGYSRIKEKLVNLFSQQTFIFLLLFFLWQILSVLMVENIYNLSLVFSLQSLAYLVVFIGLIVYVVLDHSSYFKMSSVFGAMAIFQAIISVSQWLRRSTLGLAIESIDETLSYLKGPGQGFFSIRSVGTFSHPNELALFSLFMALFFLPLLYLNQRQLKLKKSYYFYFFGASMIALILSLGRSAWLSFFACLLIFTYLVEKKWRKRLIKLDKIDNKNFLYFGLFLTISLLIVIPRMVSSFDLLKPSGGGEARMKLMQESLRLIKLKPFFGVGMGLGGYIMFRMNPKGIISNFPTTVHNFYLLNAIESGFPTLIFFLLFLFFLFKRTKEKFKIMKINDKIILLGGLMSILSFLINGMIQQIFLMGFFLIITSLLFTNNDV